MIFNGVNLNEYLLVQNIIGRGVMPYDIETVEPPAKDGSFFINKSVRERYINVNVVIAGNDEQDLRYKINLINQILNVDEPKEIIFDDEPNVKYYGIPQQSSENGQVVSTTTTTLTFVCPDPYKYRNEYTSNLSSDLTTINNYGAVRTYPIIELTATQSSTFAMVTKNDRDQYVMIGNASRADETTFEKETLVFHETGNSLEGWTQAENVDNGYIAGEIISEDGSFLLNKVGSAIQGDPLPDISNWEYGQSETHILEHPTNEFAGIALDPFFEHVGNYYTNYRTHYRIIHNWYTDIDPAKTNVGSTIATQTTGNDNPIDENYMYEIQGVEYSRYSSNTMRLYTLFTVNGGTTFPSGHSSTSSVTVRNGYLSVYTDFNFDAFTHWYENYFNQGGGTEEDLGYGWQGPAIKTSIGEPLQDFRMDALVEIQNIGKETRMLEIYLLDDLNNLIVKVGIEDVLRDIDRINGKFQLGNFNTVKEQEYFYASKDYGWNNFDGVIRLTREGNRFHPYFALINENGVHDWIYSRYYYTDVNEEYLDQISQVQIAMRVHAPTTNTVEKRDVMLKDLKFWRINNQDEGVPSIINAGDIITFDHKNRNILINGEPRKDLIDFGSQFFPLDVGSNELTVYPFNTFETTIKYREVLL